MFISYILQNVRSKIFEYNFKVRSSCLNLYREIQKTLRTANNMYLFLYLLFSGILCEEDNECITF